MRVALGVSYRGQAYQGWQSQPSGKTVQDQLERALARFIDQPLRCMCAGRTDTGVHAINQVVHLDTEVQRDPSSWVRGTNRYLPPDIALQWAQAVPDDFHARNSAQRRRYVYVLLESPVRPAIEVGLVGWSFRALDGELMQKAAHMLVGEHDFTSFRSAECQAASPVKQLYDITIQRSGPYWRFEFEASAFLHHMVRNIMGCLVTVGRASRAPEWMAEVLQAKDRSVAAPTFPAAGLYFVGPYYDASYAIPGPGAMLNWLPG